MRNVRAIIKILAFAIWTVCLVPVQYAFWLCQRVTRRPIVRQSPVVRCWYRGVTAILGLRIARDGRVAWPAERRVLYVCNHSSYLDILVLGAYVPGFFVARADTADWPVFGFLAKVGGTFFIDRKRSLVKQQMALFSQALHQGKQLLLFPEGTTSDALSLLPFKSSLLHVLYEPGLADMQIVPLCLTYQAVNGRVFSNVNHEIVAWYRNMTLLPHLWNVFRQCTIDVRLDVLPLIEVADHENAKSLTQYSETVIRQAFTAVAPVAAHSAAIPAAIDKTADAFR